MDTIADVDDARSREAVAAGARRRRRVWTEAEKGRIVGETLVPGASVSIVARRHDINANLLFTWRRQLTPSRVPAAAEAVTFVPATIAPGPGATEAAASLLAGRIEIVLATGERLIVGADVDAAALARVVKVLSRR
jgi:transposase